MNSKLILIALMGLILSSCATTKNLEDNLQHSVGRNINDVINDEGYPRGSFTMPNGNKVYIYSESGSYTMPITTSSTYNMYGNSIYGSSTTSGGQTINFWCRIYIETNKNNIVTKWRWEGNRCVAHKQ